MKIAFLTTEDPIYLPSFFDHVLSGHRTDSAVFIAPPLYKDQTAVAAARRYARTFGLGAALGLATRILRAKIQRQSISDVCDRYGVHCESVQDVNDPAFIEKLRAFDIDLIVSVSCPQIFKKALIDLPPRGCLNIHGAILPAYRGVMPSFWMLANDEKVAGVSIFFVNEKIDAGDLCGQRQFEILPHETLDGFLRRSKTVAAELLLEVLEQIARGTVTSTPLDLSDGSYYSWPERDDVRRFHAAGRRVW